MPVIDMETHALAGSSFSFTGARITQLGATNYTLATVAIDTTGSVMDFAAQLRAMLTAAVDACRKSPRSDNLLVRVVTFDSTNGIRELHGFKPLTEIDAASYPALEIGGMTPLYDACVNVIGAVNDYAARLDEEEFAVNAITFVVTDGVENASSSGVGTVRDLLHRGVVDEKLESHESILIGIGIDQTPQGQHIARTLAAFQRDAGLSRFIDAGEATPQKLAKLGQFVSQSISSTSQALGTGGPSQSIAATI